MKPFKITEEEIVGELSLIKTLTSIVTVVVFVGGFWGIKNLFQLSGEGSNIASNGDDET